MESESDGVGRPRGRLRLPLKVKLSLLITALVVLAVGLVGLFLLRQAQTTLTAEMTKRGLTIAENLAAGAKSSLLANDDLTLSILIKDAMKDPDVAYVAITDEDGTVRAHSDLALIGKPLARPSGLEQLADRPLVRTYTLKGQGRIIDFAQPLVFSEVRVGALYLGFSEATIRSSPRPGANPGPRHHPGDDRGRDHGRSGTLHHARAPDLPAGAGHPGHRLG